MPTFEELEKEQEEINRVLSALGTQCGIQVEPGPLDDWILKVRCSAHLRMLPRAMTVVRAVAMLENARAMINDRIDKKILEIKNMSRL